MHFTIEKGQGVLRAELFGRSSAQELPQFVGALNDSVRSTGMKRVLVWVRNSRPIFKVDQAGLPEQFRLLAGDPEYRVALLADSEELRSSHEYIEMLARQQGAALRAFRDEGAALAWLLGDAQSQEKR